MESILPNFFENLESTITGYKGSFNPYYQNILFNISEEVFFREFNDKSSSNHKIFRKLFIHELRHFLDFTTSIWGINFLADIFEGFNARATDNENNFPKIITFLNKIKKLSYLDFYTTNGLVYSNTNYFWKVVESIGYRYNYLGKLDYNSPIIFCRFYNSDTELIDSNTHNYIKRVPLSPAALLETMAMTEILNYDIQTIPNKNLIVEDYLYNWILNPNKGVYTVCYHLVASYSKSNNLRKNFNLASVISAICLNFDYSLASNLKTPDQITQILFETDIHRTFISSKDPGYLFYVLLRNAHEQNIKIDTDNINEILNCSGLPNIDYFNSFIRSSEIKIKYDLGPLQERMNFFLKARSKIINQYNNLDVNFAQQIIGHNEILPKLFFDNYTCSIIDYKTYKYNKENDFNNWNNYVYSITKKIDEFWKACS